MEKCIDIVAVTYGQTDILKCFINSIKSQTNKNWRLFIVHDGNNKPLHKELVNQGYLDSEKIMFVQFPKRTENYGHKLRGWSLKNLVKSEYVLLTNGDNYYSPIMVEEVLNRDEEFIYFDLVHSHSSKYNNNKDTYGYMKTHLVRGTIDMGCVVIKSDLAKKVGFGSTEYHADWIYFDSVLKLSQQYLKLIKFY
jgi:choline kinase